VVETIETGRERTLTARPADRASFAAYGRLLGVGDRAHLEGSNGMMISVDENTPLPDMSPEKGLRHLSRLPKARRVIVAPARVRMWLVVLDGEGEPAAFLLPQSATIVIERGIWHAGPFALAPVPVVELIETHGPVDRMERATVLERLGVERLRVELPKDSRAGAPGWHLEAPDNLRVDAASLGRVRVGLFGLEGLSVAPVPDALQAELHDTATGLRATWGPSADFDALPVVQDYRRLLAHAGFEDRRRRAPFEVMLARVFQGHVPNAAHVLEAALRLVSLRHSIALSAFDAARITPPVVLRRGQVSETIDTDSGGRLRIAGVTLLSDAAGAFSSLLGDAARVAPDEDTTRVVIAAYLAPDGDRETAANRLQVVSTATQALCGGRITGLQVVGV
jgi:DNA/RNA-binding domain of Phe-tRNA-synthetase-like protein/ureidoglycolate hydrolase